jgi:hypothetical protein
MKVKMYGYAIKWGRGKVGFGAHDDPTDREADVENYTTTEPVARFTFTLDIDPAALFPPEPEFAAAAVEVE